MKTLAAVSRATVAIGALLFGGLVMERLWGWHVAETFGIHRLSYGEALGLEVLASYVTYRFRDTREWTLEDWTYFTLSAFEAAGWALLIGWLIQVWA